MPGFSPSDSARQAVAAVVAAACSNARTIARCLYAITAVITMLALPVNLTVQLAGRYR
ncbi:MAG: hypothetical protein ACREPQ_13710 [Rhodanobacter sp.]